MQQLFRMRDADGNDYDVPNSDMAEFSGAVPNAANVTRYRDADGNDYDVPDADKAEFSAAVPNAQPLRRVSFANGTTRDFTMPEMAKFLRSKEWRESDDYKADREERDRAVNAKLGEDGEMHSPAWAGVKGALKGAVQGAWGGGNAAANKIVKAIPEIGNSLESALGNTINLFGNAPNALGNWFLADSASGKAWLDANFPSETKEWTGYEDWSTKTADKFADVSAMAYKFAPAMATGGSTALVNTMFASDGINAASQTFDNAIENGFTMGEANAAAAASFLVNFYGAKLMTKAGGVAGDVPNPLLRFFGEAGAVGAAMGAQGAGNKGIENVVNGRPITEGMGDAFAEGEVEGFMFHGINAIPGAVMSGWSAAERRIRETRELKEYRRDSLLEVARGEGGGELLNTLLPGEGLDAAIRARKSGEDVSRKIGEKAGLPDNMSVAERNEIIDAIARARGERAAQNAVKIDGFRADALNEAIKGVVGGEEYADAIRAEVLSNIKSARELDNPVRRMELVEEAAQKVSAPDEHRAKSMAGMEERARRKADMAEYEKQEAERKAREEAEQNAPRIAVSDLPAETPAAPAETGRGQFPEYYEWLDKTGKKDSDKNWRKFVAENDLDPALAGKRPEPPAEKPAEKPAVKPDGKGKMVPVEPKPAEIDKDSLSNYVKRGDGELGRFSVPGAEEGTKGWITGHSKDGADGQYHLNLKKVWNPKEGFDGTEFGRDMLEHAANNFCDQMEKAGVKVDRRQIVADFSSGNETYDIGELIKIVGRGKFEEAMRKLGYDGFVSLADDGIVTAFDPAAVVRAKAAAKPAETRPVAETGKETPEPAKPVETPSRAPDAKESLKDIIERDLTARRAEKWDEADAAKDAWDDLAHKVPLDELRSIHKDIKAQLAENPKDLPLVGIEGRIRQTLEAREKAESPKPDGKGRMVKREKPINATPVEDTKFGQAVLDGAHFLNEGYKSRQNIPAMDAYRKDVSDAMSKASDHDLQTVIEVAKANRGRQYAKKKNIDGKAIESDKWRAWEDIRTLAEKELAKRATPAQPVPDGKGKMVKPKAAESDYGITMSEEPSVDGDGVRYVVKDGPSDAHRMMFKSKAEAEARLGELRAERKAIMESPSATLADGKKIRLLKTDEGWVPYDENYNDLRHGMFKAAKTKAEAVEVAEKGVKWARDVAEENARLKAESAKPKPDGKGKMVKPAAQKKPVKANPKKAAKVVEEFVSKDKTRTSLQSVFHDHENGVAVASDGRVLIATKHGYDPNAKRDPENPFPNWKQIVPDYSKGSYEHIERVVENGKSSLQQKWLDVQEAEVDPAAVSSACKKAAALANKIKHSNPVYVRFELPDGKSMIFDGANLRRVADAMAANGITKIKAVGPKAPLLAENADTTILAMPVKFGDADFKLGRGGEHFVIDARTGRVLSAPERSDNVAMFSREWADDLRRQIAKGKAETIDYVKKSSLFKGVLDAVKRGETDAKTAYEGIPSGDNWETLSQGNKDTFAEWLKLKDENAIAEKMAEHLADSNIDMPKYSWRKKLPAELEKIEKRIAAEDEIDSLMSGSPVAPKPAEVPAKRVPDGKGKMVKPEAAKPSESTDREKYDAAKEKYRKAQEEAKKSDGKTPIDKELGSILDSNSPMGVNVRDAATEIIERLTEKYGEGVADELDAHFGKFFKDIEKDNMRRSRAESLIRAFVNSLPRKYELDGWREEIAPRKFEKMGLPDADSIQERLLDLTDEFYGTDFEEAFAPLKFRKIDEAKLSAKDKAAFGKLRNEFEDAIDDLEKSLDLVSTETRTGERRIRGEVQQDVIDTFTSARENVERFLEQAEKYQALKRDKKGRPLFSLAPDGELDFFTEPKNEKAKLQRIEPVASEPAKSPEQEIAERLDLKRLDPKRRSDPKVLAWAKKNGRNVTNGMATPDAVRAYDEAMTEATAKRARRWFPDMKIVAHKFGETIKRGVHVIDLRDTSGGVLGWFDPKSKEVHLLPGADPKTVAHEIMWHGTRQYMTDLAAKGDARAQKFLDMMHDVEQNAPQAIKDLVNRIYARGGKAISRDTLLNEYGAWFTMGKGGEALEKALQKAENRNWFARGLHTVKEMVKDFLTAHGRNRVDLSAIDGMTRDEFVDFLAKEFSGGKTLGNIKGKQPPTLSTKETALQRYKRRFYDQNAAVRDLERDIEKKTGRKISADDSVEAANALKYGLKEAANIETQGEMREFRKVLAETGIHYEDFEYYAALKAAAGRDAKIDARNIAKLTADLRSQGASAQDIADAVANYKSSNGSHIDPREARMMLNEIENGPDAAKFKKAYDAIRPIIDATLDTQVKAGLVGATEAAQWRTEEPYYIPFKNEYDAETGEWAGRGMSRNYAKPEHYTAKGRQSAAGDILAHIFMDHQAAKLRAIENGVRQKLANLVRANPELGKVEVLGDNEAGIEANNPNVVVFKDGGRAYKITLEGTRGEAIANAFTQRNQLKMGWADRKFMGISMRGFARATAGMATRYSPTFAVRNTTKDNIELANIVYSERGPIEGSKFMGRYIASRAQMAGTLAKYITTGKIDVTTAHGKILDRYIKAGGLIAGGTRAEAFDSIKKSLTPEAIAKEMRRGNSKTRAVAKHVLNSIGYLNEYAEMATRVGIFDAEIKAGKSDAEAALFARRATVDFNRHGDWTPAFNMFRLFSNSTLGASARAAAALTKSKYGAAAMGALFVNGLARAFIDHFVNAEEDERRRKTGEATGKDISEYERRTSLFYFRNGDKLYKVAEHESPFSLVSYAGDCVGRWICGDLDGKQVAKNLGVTTAEVAYNFLPMGSINLTAQNGGFAEDAKSALISGVVPTAAQPIAELWANVDYAGRTIYNDPGHDNKTPRAEQGRDSTPDWAKEAAVKLNESTRSEGSRKGYVDIPPEAIQKLVEGYGKNALRDVSMAVSIGEAIIKGDFSKLDPRNEPVKRDFVRPLDGNDKRFIAATKEFEANLDYFKKTEMTEDERADYLAKFPHIRGKRGSDLLAAIKKFRKMERGFAYKNGKAIPHEWPQEKLDEFKEKRRALQAQFLELMGDK